MSFYVLFKDELKGFYKSKVMLVLWVGLPLMAIFFSLLNMDTEGVPLVVFVGLMATSLSGTLASVMLSTTIVKERTDHVYDLFLIRPVKRAHILLAKLAAVYVCLVLALFLTLGIRIILDIIRNGIPTDPILQPALEAIAMSMASMAIACCMGILIGLITDNVMVAAILSIYLGNQLSIAAALPGIFITSINSVLFSVIVGVGASSLLIFAIIKIFEKKQI